MLSIGLDIFAFVVQLNSWTPLFSSHQIWHLVQKKEKREKKDKRGRKKEEGERDIQKKKLVASLSQETPNDFDTLHSQRNTDTFPTVNHFLGRVSRLGTEGALKTLVFFFIFCLFVSLGMSFIHFLNDGYDEWFPAMVHGRRMVV